jgi:hypothetical protein
VAYDGLLGAAAPDALGEPVVDEPADDAPAEPEFGGRWAGLAGRDGAAAGCGRKLAVERGGEFGGAARCVELGGADDGGGVLLTEGRVAGRTGDAGPAEAEAAGADRPGVLGRPAAPPLATARAAALSAALPPAGRPDGEPLPTGRVAPGAAEPELPGFAGRVPLGAEPELLGGRVPLGACPDPAGPDPAGREPLGAEPDPAGRVPLGAEPGPAVGGLAGSDDVRADPD